MAYIDLDTLKAYMQGSAIAVGSDHDDLLEECIARAQAIIEAQPPLGTGRAWEAPADTTRYFDAERDVYGRDLLFLDMDLCAITSVTVNGDALSSADYVPIPRNTTPYHGIRIKRNADDDWSWDDDPEDAIAVTGRWAYATTAPAEIVQLACRLAAYLYRQRTFSSETERPIITAGATILPSALPSDVRDAIAALAQYGGRA